MKGLIIKDMMCLRKQRITFFYITFCVVVLSVMYVLSAKFGNIAIALQMTQTENHLGDIDVKNISTNVLLLFMLLPIAMVGDVVIIVTADEKADFEKLSAAMPISLEKRVLARYISVGLMTGMGVLVDVILAFGLSLLTDIVSFREFLGIIITAASVMVLHGTLTILYHFLFGFGKENYAQLAAVFSILLGMGIAKRSAIKQICLQLILNTELDRDRIASAMHFVKYQSYILLLISLVVSAVSYCLALLVAKKKRGII